MGLSARTKIKALAKDPATAFKPLFIVLRSSPCGARAELPKSLASWLFKFLSCRSGPAFMVRLSGKKDLMEILERISLELWRMVDVEGKKMKTERSTRAETATVEAATDASVLANVCVGVQTDQPVIATKASIALQFCGVGGGDGEVVASSSQTLAAKLVCSESQTFAPADTCDGSVQTTDFQSKLVCSASVQASDPESVRVPAAVQVSEVVPEKATSSVQASEPVPVKMLSSVQVSQPMPVKVSSAVQVSEPVTVMVPAAVQSTPNLVCALAQTTIDSFARSATSVQTDEVGKELVCASAQTTIIELVSAATQHIAMASAAVAVETHPPKVTCASVQAAPDSADASTVVLPTVEAGKEAAVEDKSSVAVTGIDDEVLAAAEVLVESVVADVLAEIKKEAKKKPKSIVKKKKIAAPKELPPLRVGAHVLLKGLLQPQV